jgi:hypothetical protein
MSDGNGRDRKGDSRRVCERLSLVRKAVLELETGDILVGDTVDISLRGALLEVDLLPDADLSGLNGTLFMIGEDGDHSSGFPCQVVRVTARTVAIRLDKKVVAAFGQLITREVFGRGGSQS